MFGSRAQRDRWRWGKFCECASEHLSISEMKQGCRMLYAVVGIVILTRCAVADVDYVEYLKRYGYLEKSGNTTLVDQESVRSAIEIFQRKYNLTVDGEMNNETLELMSKPRCGNADSPLPFTIFNNNTRWSNNTISWYWYGHPQYLRLVEMAFSVWSKHAHLKFDRSYYTPNIPIMFDPHVVFETRLKCRYPFDGVGGVLAHAFPPYITKNQTDIHVDYAEPWEFGMALPAAGKSSLFSVLVHEIGHSLGLSHSSQRDSVMFPIHGIPRNIVDMYELDLSADDINGIQYLYGPPVTTSTSSSTTTTTTTTESIPVPPRLPQPPPPPPQLPALDDLCDYKNTLNTIVIVRNRIFMFRNKHVWVVDMDETSREPSQFTRPKIIKDWLPFLPHDFKNITAVYERPNGEIVLFVGNEIFFVGYPSLKLIFSTTVQRFLGFPDIGVRAAVNSHRGLTYIITDNDLVFEMDECKFTANLLGAFTTVFPDLPKHITGAFRYTNGRLYFSSTSTVTYEYNEFSNRVTRTVPSLFDVLQISCMEDNILKQLHSMVSKLLHLKSD